MSIPSHGRITRVAVASERRPKVEAVRRALSRIAKLRPEEWSDVEVLARSADSGVRATPLSDAEMRRGARQRALALREQLAHAPRHRHRETAATGRTLYVGLEGGVHVEHDADDLHAWLRGWAFACENDVSSWGCGPSIALPPVVARAVIDGEDLARVIDRVSGESDVRSRGGTWGILTLDLLTRAASFEAALLAALSRFYNPAAFVTSESRTL